MADRGLLEFLEASDDDDKDRRKRRRRKPRMWRSARERASWKADLGQAATLAEDSGSFTFALPLKPFVDGGWYWYDVVAGDEPPERVPVRGRMRVGGWRPRHHGDDPGAGVGEQQSPRSHGGVVEVRRQHHQPLQLARPHGRDPLPPAAP